MPQSSDHLRARMNELFGDSIDDYGPQAFLKDAGYVLDRSFFWHPKPGLTSWEDVTDDEYDCIIFLREEWDYDGLDLPTIKET